MDNGINIGSTKAEEHEQSPYYALAFLADSDCDNKDLKAILPYIEPNRFGENIDAKT